MVRPLGQFGVDGNEVLNLADLRRQDDAITRQSDLLRKFGRDQRRLHNRLARHLLCGQWRTVCLVLIHEARQQFLIKRSPVYPDAYRLVVADRRLDNCAKLYILLLPEIDVAGIDAVFRQGLGTGRMVSKELVSDVMEVTDERNVDPKPLQPIANERDSGRGLVAVNRDAYQF